MQYPMKCKTCKHKKILDIALRMYIDNDPHMCTCGGELERYFPSEDLVAIRTTSSPSR